MNMTKFDFKLNCRDSKTFTANLMDRKYLVTWMDKDSKLDWVTYNKIDVEEFIEEGAWIPVEEVACKEEILNSLRELYKYMTISEILFNVMTGSQLDDKNMEIAYDEYAKENDELVKVLAKFFQ